MKSAKCLKLPEHLQSSNDRATARRSSVKQCSFFSDRTGKLRFSENYKVAIIAPRDEHCSRTSQIPDSIFSKKDSNEGFVPKLSQRLNRVRHMLITRSDDGHFGRCRAA